MTASAAARELVISRVFNALLWSAPSREHTAGASAPPGRRYHAHHALLLLGVMPAGSGKRNEIASRLEERCGAVAAW